MILSPVVERKFPRVRIDGSQMTEKKNAPDKNIKRRDFVSGLAAISASTAMAPASNPVADEGSGLRAVHGHRPFFIGPY
jgi:hypothetical protein